MNFIAQLRLLGAVTQVADYLHSRVLHRWVARHFRHP